MDNNNKSKNGNRHECIYVYYVFLLDLERLKKETAQANSGPSSVVTNGFLSIWWLLIFEIARRQNNCLYGSINIQNNNNCLGRLIGNNAKKECPVFYHPYLIRRTEL